MPFDDRAIAISATFTAEAIQPGLAFWIAELGLACEIRFAGYAQLFQELLDPSGLFARNRGGFNVALVRLEDWLPAGIEDSARKFVAAVRAAAERLPSPLIIVVCPPTSDLETPLRIVCEGTRDLATVHCILPVEVTSLYPVARIHDPHGDQLGHLPYTPEFFVALATAIARKIHAISQPPFKVVALDCDETLWAGICGEDGPQAVVVDPPRRALQQFMAERRREGMLLALCSKNNEEDVAEVFASHPDMPLGPRDFASQRVNWQSKGVNLASLAEELELGLDSFILVDDNPKECTEAQASAPQVLALPLPAQPAAIPQFLRHIWAFDRPRVTAEDERRAELYAQRADRTRAQKASGSLEEFLASLQLEVEIAPMRDSQLARVAQLTLRTNQMNATCVRRTESEVRKSGLECHTVTVRDRFGDYGLTGVLMFQAASDALAVDTFLLSCRALGRGVEHRMVAHLGKLALERGLKQVRIPFLASQRNRPAALFLQSIAQEAAGVSVLSADQAANLVYVPASTPAEPVSESTPAQAPPPRRVDYLKIATELSDPAAVLQRIGAAGRQGRVAKRPADPPRTPLERELTELWAALLHVPAVGIHDNFFELGGHSLLAVQLLSRVRQTCGVDLSLEVVYSGEFTVAELAKAVELKEIEQAGGEYQDLLAELDGLSDEEVRALLAEEQDS
ncbi:MAG TPA: HAD-IIIC family phosphatase [Candidatus Sulfopaludibacter sp.]|jgi:FkbH-like protein|nr:HAD-IIIC family phosphatase [Candidatus Sulfopaludibacter sp.]